MELIPDPLSERKRLESLLIEGIESGLAEEFTAEDWAELKRRVWQRHQMKEIVAKSEGNTNAH